MYEYGMYVYEYSMSKMSNYGFSRPCCSWLSN